MRYLQEVCEMSLEKYNLQSLTAQKVVHDIFNQADNELHSSLENYYFIKLKMQE